MKKILISVLIIIVIFLVFSFALGGWHGGAGFGPMHGGGSDSADPVARGGRGYDKFWIEYDIKAPDTLHASYPFDAKAKPSDSWRCKECHGWDYSGSEGAYRSGSHKTGITGILESNGQPIESIVAILSNETHGYHTVLPKRALEEISLFVAQGQIDMRPLIDYESKAVTGDSLQGKTTYTNICADCHGKNGKTLNFSHEADEAEYVGTVASDNPWEALHKIRNGHPGAYVNHMTGRHTDRRGMGTSFMPPMRTRLTTAEQTSLLAYLQTLPIE